MHRRRLARIRAWLPPVVPAQEAQPRGGRKGLGRHTCEEVTAVRSPTVPCGRPDLIAEGHHGGAITRRATGEQRAEVGTPVAHVAGVAVGGPHRGGVRRQPGLHAE